MSDDIPGILDYRFRLLPLSIEQARQAIVKPSQVEHESIKTRPFTFAPETVDMMSDFLCRSMKLGKLKKTDEVESFQLQLLCRHIEKYTVPLKAKKEKRDDIIIEPGDLGGEKGMQQVLECFYEDLLDQFEPGESRKRIRKLCEEGLISESKRRLSLEKDEIIRKFNITEGELAQLTDFRLVRPEPWVGSVYYELSHDTLTDPIREFQKKQENHVDFINKLSVKALNKEVGTPASYEKSALSCIRNGEPKIAVEIYRQAVDGEPGNADIYESIADELITKRNDELAKDVYDCAFKSGSKNANFYYSLGHRYHLLKKYNEAIGAFQKALELDPENISNKVALAENYFLVKDYEKAGSLAMEAVETKNIAAELKLVSHFIAAAAMLFLRNKNEADAQLTNLDNFYNSLPVKHEGNWSYQEMENLIRENKEILGADAERLLQKIKILEYYKDERKYQYPVAQLI